MKGAIYMALNLKNDIVFKAFFARKGNEEFLIDFLEALLKIKIKTIKIAQEVDLGKLVQGERTGRLDVQAILNDEVVVDIEMQVTNQHNIVARTTFYGTKQLSMMAAKGEKYNEIKKVVMINILDYEFLPYDECVSETVIVLNQHREYEVIDKMKWYFIELPKFRKQNLNMNEKINQWLAFIDNSDEELVKMAESKNEVLKRARLEMDYLTGDEEIKRLEYLREKWRMDYNSGINWAKKQGEKAGIAKGERKGKKAGIKQAQFEIARELLKNHVAIEIIVKSTGLTKEEVENL